METNREFVPMSDQPNRSFGRSSSISIISSPISTMYNLSPGELSPVFELSLSSTEPDLSFDQSSDISIDPTITMKQIPSSNFTSFAEVEPKPSSEICLGSETNKITKQNTCFNRCLTVNPATHSIKSNRSSNPAIVSPQSLFQFLTLLSPPSKSKGPVSHDSFKYPTRCDGMMFSFTKLPKFCTPQSILKCATCGERRLIGPPRKVKPDVSTEPAINDASPVSVSQVKKATGGFSHSLLIGQGLFSSVYDGTLKDGTRVAIKCDKKSLYNPKSSIEFQSNIKILQNMDHPNLVKLYGYLEHNENSIFILQYVPNGNLRQHLDGKYMGFGQRLDIAIDVAHGLAFLHEYQDKPIIHGRLQSSNILLSNNMRAMVSDYGFPPVSGVRFDSSSSNIVVLSYCDPEFLFTFRFTEQSDVYSFGVVLVELLTGRPPLMGDPECFDYVTTEWAKTMFEQGKGSVILDPHIPRIPATMIIMEKVLALAVLCLNREGKDRPTMSFCAEALEHISNEYTLILFGPHDENR